MNNRNLDKPNGKGNESVERLGVILKVFIDERIQPNKQIFDSIVKALKELLPTDLAQQCRISGITGGQLKILVNSPCYMYELSLCSSELLAQLQRRCPQVRLKEIKFAVG